LNAPIREQKKVECKEGRATERCLILLEWRKPKILGCARKINEKRNNNNKKGKWVVAEIDG
jgi:hypothetical protein